MSQLLYGSINYDALLKEIRTGKIQTFVTDSGVRLVNINVWVNDEPNNYDNDASIQLQLKSEHRGDKAPYIGNLRKYIKKEPTPGSENNFPEGEDDDLPF